MPGMFVGKCRNAWFEKYVLDLQYNLLQQIGYYRKTFVTEPKHHPRRILLGWGTCYIMFNVCVLFCYLSPEVKISIILSQMFCIPDK